MRTRRARWGPDVETTTVLGHPCRAFRDRPHHLADVLAEAAAHDTATHLLQGEQRLSFDAVTAAAAAVGQALRDEGLSQGDRVALAGANSTDWVIAFWACVTQDLVLVPLNAWWSSDEMAHALEHTSARLVIADERRLARVPAGTEARSLENLRRSIPQPAGAAAGSHPNGPETGAAEDDPAVLVFTSGTTGAAKAATLSHRNLLATLQNLLSVAGRLPGQQREAARGSVTLVSLPLFHIGGIQQILTSMVNGATLVFLDGRFDPTEVLDRIERERVAVWSAVPTMVARVLDRLERSPGRWDVSSLRNLSMGGSPIAPALRERAARAFPSTTRGLGISYGLTESTGVVATGVGRSLDGADGAVGSLLPTVEARIDCPDATGVGELLVRSPGVMVGYWGLPADPILTADRWLRTGDRARVDGDQLCVVGREKDVIIRGGENIASRHVEERLADHPDVVQVAVVPLPHPDLGEEVGAVVVRRPGAPADPADLADFAAAGLAYFEVPSRWWVRDEALPLNAMGKVLKHQLTAEWPASESTDTDTPSPRGAR